MKDFFFLIWVKPFYFWVATEPRQLFFDVAARVLLYHADGEIARPSAIEIVEQLLVTHRVKRIQLTNGYKLRASCSNPCSIIYSVRWLMRS